MEEKLTFDRALLSIRASCKRNARVIVIVFLSILLMGRCQGIQVQAAQGNNSEGVSKTSIQANVPEKAAQSGTAAKSSRWEAAQSGTAAKSSRLHAVKALTDGNQTRARTSMVRLKSKLTAMTKGYSGTWSVYVRRLDTGETIMVNGSRKHYAASIIKLYAMAAAYQKVKEGKLSEAGIYRTLYNMITVSDNAAFNQIVRWIGKSYINTWCKANGYRSTNEGHGLQPAGNYAGLSNGSGRNKTTVSDVGKLLTSIYRGTCVDETFSGKMLSLLKQQKRRSKIPAGVPRSVTVANKTGETNSTTHDAAIVWSKGTNYVLVVMASTGNAYYETRHIPVISRTVYNYLNN